MFLKVIIVLYLLNIYAQGNPSELQQSLSQAISSQSFYRKDIPFSYEHSSVHVYTSPNPSSTPKSPSRKIEEIQYAPLHQRPDRYTTKDVPSSSEIHPNIDEYPTEPTFRKDKLEPQVFASSRNESYGSYFVPGYNIKILESVNRPSTNPGFSTFTEPEQNKQRSKTNFMRKYLIYQRQQSQNSPQNSIRQKPRNAQVFAIIHNPHYSSGSNTLSKTGLLSMIELRSPSQPLYPKDHRLHLNVARVYNFAQTPLKAPSNTGAYEPNIQVPTQTQAYIQSPQKSKLRVPTENKTILYPV